MIQLFQGPVWRQGLRSGPHAVRVTGTHIQGGLASAWLSRARGRHFTVVTSLASQEFSFFLSFQLGYTFKSVFHPVIKASCVFGAGRGSTSAPTTMLQELKPSLDYWQSRCLTSPSSLQHCD